MPQRPQLHADPEPTGLQWIFLRLFCPALPEISSGTWTIVWTCLELIVLHSSVIVLPLAIWNVSSATGLLGTGDPLRSTSLHPTSAAVAVTALCLLSAVLWKIDQHRKAHADHLTPGSTLSGGAYQRWLQLQESIRQSLPALPEAVKTVLPLPILLTGRQQQQQKVLQDKIIHLQTIILGQARVADNHSLTLPEARQEISSLSKEVGLSVDGALQQMNYDALLMEADRLADALEGHH